MPKVPNELASPIADSLVTEWQEAAKQSDYWQQREKELRVQLFKLGFPKPEYGTNKIRISHGMALIGDYRMNYRIDRPLLESASSEPSLRPLLDRVVAYRPEVRPGEFRKLTKPELLQVAAIITETPSPTPGLELKPQNKVRW